MSTPPQDLKITYGSLVFGTGTEDDYVVIDGAYSIQFTRLSADVNFNILVFGTSNADLITNINTVVDAFRQRRKQLKIEINSNTVRDFDPSGTINKDALPTIEELFDDHYTLTTRAFSVSIPVDMPPAESNGRTEETVSLSEDESRIQTVVITASYNSTASATALALMNADFATYAVTIQSFFSIANWELVSKPDVSTIPIINNQITIRAIYRELIFDQRQGIRDDSDLVDFVLTVDITKSHPGDSRPKQLKNLGRNLREPRRLVDIKISMATNVVKSVSDLEAKWVDDIRPYIINYAKTLAGGVQVVSLPNDTVRINPVSSTISADIAIQAATEGAGQVIASSIVANLINNPGALLVPAHDTTPYGKFHVPVKAQRIRTISETYSVVNTDFIIPIRNPKAVGKGPRWVDQNTTDGVKPTYSGPLTSGEGFSIIEITFTNLQEWITDPKTKMVGGLAAPRE